MKFVQILEAIFRRKVYRGGMEKTELKRCISTLELIGFGIATMIGAGLFVMTGTIMKNKAGPATWISYGLAGFAALLNAFAYAELSAKIPRSGSAYDYVYSSAGELMGFLVGWAMCLEYLLCVSSVARGWSGVFNSITDDFARNLSITVFGDVAKHTDNVIDPDFVSVLLVIICTVPLLLGAKKSVILSMVFTGITILSILITIGVQFSFANLRLWTHSRHGFLPFGVGGLFSGAGSSFFAFVGFDIICLAGEEVQNPKIALPVAISVSVLVVTLIFMLASGSLTLMIPWHDVSITAPFVFALKSKGVIWAMYVCGIGALFGITACLITSLYGLPRLIYAMAHDGLLPRGLAVISKSTQIPYVAIIIGSIVAAVITFLISIEVLADLVSIGTLFAYIIVTGVVIYLRFIHMNYNDVSESDDKSHTSSYSKDSDAVSKEPFPGTIVNEKTRLYDTEPTTVPGSLKPQFASIPVLRDCAPRSAVIISILGMIITSVALACMLLYSPIEHGHAVWWSIVLLAIFLFGLCFCAAIIRLHEEVTNITTFKVPAMPLIPMLAILVNLLLIVRLSWLTWVRLVGWMIIGCAIYFFYGMWHSDEYLYQVKHFEEMQNDDKDVNTSDTPSTS